MNLTEIEKSSVINAILGQNLQLQQVIEQLRILNASFELFIDTLKVEVTKKT